MTDTPFRVLSAPLAQEPNFYRQDPLLHDLLARHLSHDALAWLTPQLEKMGADAAGPVEQAAALADKNGPQIKPIDRYGNPVYEIVYHPAYRELQRIGYGGGMVATKYEPELRSRFGGQLQVAGFAISYLFAQTEAGMTCPACMTDGVARVLEHCASEDQKQRYIPRLASRDLSKLFTGAMFLTEKQGGSDVGLNATRAVQQPDGTWRLWGDKWFCSNVDAEAALVLARPEGAPAGTRGLGLFLLPRTFPDGTRNALRVNRLKDKLGVRSMASGEVIFEGAYAELVGPVDQGFKQMAEMLNLSRLWNAVCSMSCVRRAIFEATEYLRRRKTFGRFAIEHPLVRETLADLNAEDVGGKHLIFQMCVLLDAGDRGDETARALTRILTPLAKYTTAKTSVWAASEGIELIGGNGYIEDSPMPRLLRDAQVLPVWEGTTNILILDTLRACSKTGAHQVLMDDVRRRCAEAPKGLQIEADRVRALLARAEEDLAVIASEGPDRAAGRLKRFTDALLYSYEIALLLEGADAETRAGAIRRAAVRRLLRRHANPELETSAEDIAALVDSTVLPAA